MKKSKKILIIRNDKLGDFMLAWPAIALLKKQYPESEVTVLVPEYTAPLADYCDWIDKVLVDSKDSNFIIDITHLIKNIKLRNFDLSISLFSETRTSLALWLAGVKLRFGPATKIAQLFLNRKLRQKRSLSLKPEYEYNVDLIKFYIKSNHELPVSTPTPPYLSFNKSDILSLRNSLNENYQAVSSDNIIMLHPGTGGSASNLTIKQYAELIGDIAFFDNVYFIISAGPGEMKKSKELSSHLSGIRHHIHESKEGIINFCKLINACDLFISGSTGPLHIAGALNIPTAAFYPSKKSATSLRWQTTNIKDYRISFMPEQGEGKNDLQSINITECSEKIHSFLTKLNNYSS